MALPTVIAATAGTNAESLAHRAQLGPVTLEFCSSLVEGAEGLASQLDLPARLEGDVRVTARKPDNPPLLLDRFPTEVLTHSAENCLDTVRAGKRDRLARSGVDSDTLHLGTNNPV